VLTIDFLNCIKSQNIKKYTADQKSSEAHREVKVKHFLWHGRCSLFAAAAATTTLKKICKKCHNNKDNNNELRSESQKPEKQRIHYSLLYPLLKKSIKGDIVCVDKNTNLRVYKI